MKKIFRILSGALLALFALSCAYENEPSSPAPVSQEAGLREVSIDVVFDDAVKAGLGSDRSVTWEIGDEVAVYDYVGLNPRKFTVTAVSDGKAVISGEMDGSVSKIFAVRPFSAADFCLSDGQLRIKLPDTLTVPAAGNIDPSALVSVATCAPGDVMHFHNAVSLIKFEVTRDDITSVVVAGTRREKLGGVATVTAADGAWVKSNTASELRIVHASGKFAPGTYYATVFPASLSYGFGAHCYKDDVPVCSKITGVATEFSRNGSYNLGDISTLSGVAPKIYEEVTYSSARDMVSKSGITALSDYMWYLEPQYLKNYNNKLYAYKFTYPSVDPMGNPTVLSAVLYVPQSAIDNKTAVTGIGLVSHGTVTSAREAPTRTGSNAEAIVCYRSNAGYAVVMADNYGLGVSEYFPQSYLDAEGVARGNLDALAAAKTILAAKGVGTGSELVNFGYSQGGFGSMATLRYVSMHPELGIKISQTVSGAGPHDINLFYDLVTEDTYTQAACFFPLTIVSANENGHLGLSYDNIFREPLLSHLDEWVFSKDYSSNSIRNFLGDGKLSEIVLPPLISQTGHEAETLISYFAKHDLTTGWTPAQGSTICIFHSSQDDTVPVDCSDDLYNYLKTFETSQDLTLTFNRPAAGTHNGAILQFATSGIASFQK